MARSFAARVSVARVSAGLSLPLAVAVALTLSLSSSARAQPAPAASAPAPSAAPAPSGDASEPGAPRRLRLDECVAMASTQNIEVVSAAEDVTIAEARRGEVRGKFGPKVHVDGSLQRWNESYVFGGFPIHDTTVWNVTATVTQPITELFGIYDAYRVQDIGVDIAAVRREVTRREAAFQSVQGFYKLLQAERLAEVAVASVDQLGAQLRQADTFHTNGIVSGDDVLRAKLALANAQQRVIQARARVTVERARLALVLGMTPDAYVDAEPLATDRGLPLRDATSLEQAERTALAERVELREIDKRIDAMDHDTRLAYLKLAPRVDLVGAYIHNEGSLFTQPNAGYVGGVASWDVWDWGTTTSGVSEAKAHARQAVLAKSKLSDRVRLEVRQAFVNVGATAEAMTVAQASIASAEENFRLVTKRYEASSATSFDVVDAEGLLTQARGQMQTALYDFVIARAALRHATGATPETLARE